MVTARLNMSSMVAGTPLGGALSASWGDPGPGVLSQGGLGDEELNATWTSMRRKGDVFRNEAAARSSGNPFA
jgi:hypothetical protein